MSSSKHTRGHGSGRVYGNDHPLARVSEVIERWNGQEPVVRQLWALPLIVPLVVVLVAGLYRHAPEGWVKRTNLPAYWQVWQEEVALQLFSKLGLQRNRQHVLDIDEQILGAVAEGTTVLAEGTEAFEAGTAMVWVDVPVVTDMSQVLVKFNVPVPGGFETQVVEGGGFWVRMRQEVPAAVTFSWWVVGNDGEEVQRS